ncbi:MAG: hypothetical protein FWG08_00475 [Propionibacteriaceae bacterium]|nr:hypothetical protein [Propionibacteriaceae bacterium]
MKSDNSKLGKKRTLKKMCAMVALALSYSGLTSCNTPPQPEEAVLAFMGALESGQVVEALKLGNLGTRESAMLKDEVYEAATDRPAKTKVVAVDNATESSAVVSIEFTQAGQTLSAEFRLSLMDSDTDPWWRIDNIAVGDSGELSMVSLVSLETMGSSMTINGTQTTITGSDTFRALPGTYTFVIEETRLLQATTVEVRVGFEDVLLEVERDVNVENFSIDGGKMLEDVIETCAVKEFNLRCDDSPLRAYVVGSQECQSLVNSEQMWSLILNTFRDSYPGDPGPTPWGKDIKLKISEPLGDFSSTSCTAEECHVSAGTGAITVSGTAFQHLYQTAPFTQTTQLSPGSSNTWFVNDFVVGTTDGETLTHEFLENYAVEISGWCTDY